MVAFPEEAPEGAEDTVLTLHSPLGRVLAGHRPGDTITYATPDGPARATLLDLRSPAGVCASSALRGRVPGADFDSSGSRTAWRRFTTLTYRSEDANSKEPV
ncbi:MAG: hypothetical protein ACRDRV_21685 [Pseudonocardiaceae bacterium]